MQPSPAVAGKHTQRQYPGSLHAWDRVAGLVFNTDSQSQGTGPICGVAEVATSRNPGVGGPQRNMRTNQNVDFVGSRRAGRRRSRAGQVVACGVSKLPRGLDARDISHGTKKALAFSLERE
jgi:hypothetical protein